MFTGEEYPYSKPLPYMPYICINLKKVDSLQKAIPQEMSSNIHISNWNNIKNVWRCLTKDHEGSFDKKMRGENFQHTVPSDETYKFSLENELYIHTWFPSVPQRNITWFLPTAVHRKRVFISGFRIQITWIRIQFASCVGIQKHSVRGCNPLDWTCQTCS